MSKVTNELSFKQEFQIQCFSTKHNVKQSNFVNFQVVNIVLLLLKKGLV